MSTTPSTPEQANLSYTVVGGPRPDRILGAPFRASLLILNRGPRFDRGDALREAESLDVGELISVERSSVDVDALVREHPAVKFLLVPEVSSIGDLVNIGLAEARSRLVLVLWSDMRLESAASLGASLEAAESSGAVCVAPELSAPAGGTVPTAAFPRFQGGRFAVGHAVAGADQTPTLYPFDYCGVYRKDRFLGLGGYDRRVVSPYWQQLGLGLLAHLWGEQLHVDRKMKVSYRSELAPLDTTPDPSYRRFYLRTVAVRLRREGAYIPISRFLPFAVRSGASIGGALAEFKEARRWVAAHRQQFRLDARSLVETWGSRA